MPQTLAVHQLPHHQPIKSQLLPSIPLGDLFTYRELAMNLALKEAVWQLSAGRYQLILPQSEQPEGFEHPDVSIQIRNTDLWHVMRTDLLLAQFDGLELDAGTVAEYMMAKFLGKPTVILRSDSRRMKNEGFDEPYNLMLKNYPRTVVLHLDSLVDYLDRWEGVRPEGELSFSEVIDLEKQAIEKGVSELAEQIIKGFDEARRCRHPIRLKWPKTFTGRRGCSPAAAMIELVTEEALAELIQRLEKNGTL